MKRLPHNCRRCGEPCRDPRGLCTGCDQRAAELDAQIKAQYDLKHTPELPFADKTSGRRRRGAKRRATA